MVLLLLKTVLRADVEVQNAERQNVEKILKM
jgi:uncharacterized tellurite resistance protein B-like protein